MYLVSRISYLLFLFIIILGTVYSEAAEVSVSPAQSELVSMDFNDVDLKVIIKFMSELTGKNFIIDSSVKGTATVISPTKIPIDEAYKVLESILIVNGYTTIPSDNMVKIIPIAQAKQLDIETNVGKEITGADLKDRVVTQIVPLECADVEKLKTILTPYVSNSGYIASYSPTNTLIITDISSNLSKLLEITRDLDKPALSQPENVHVYRLENTDSVSLAQTLNKVYLEKKQQLDKETVAMPPTIVSDSSTNSLIVLASPQEYAFIEQLIKKMDVRKPQVLVEAVIAEVGLDKTKELGLEVVAAGGIVYGSSAGLAGAAVSGMKKNILTGGGLKNTTELGVVEGNKNIIDSYSSGGIISMPNLGVLIKASVNNDDVNILSAPQLLATDNQEAHILVGKQLAFIKNSQVTAEGGTVRTFEYRDVGLMLKLTPHITEDDYVRMDIIQQVEDVIGQTFEGAVETTKREAQTQATVKNNTTIVIGGLLVDKKIEKVEKVPLLGDIPLINVLFRRTKSENEKMNLFIFITPHIVRSDSDIAGITAKRQIMVELPDSTIIAGENKIAEVIKQPSPVQSESDHDNADVVRNKSVKSNVKKRGR